MIARLHFPAVVSAFVAALFATPPLGGMDVVRNGRPVATVVVAPSVEAASPEETPRKRARRGGPSDQMAAEVLVDWVRKMSGAELPIASEVPPRGGAILVGRAATQAGLKLDDINSASREGLRIRSDGRQRVLLAGQNETATVKAACRLLEHWGCRYFVDHAVGEVYPRRETVTVGRLDITEQPGFQYRSIWGSQWSGQSLWKIWNGAGGIKFSTGHAWGNYVPKDLFDQHPEYFHLIDGERRPSGWYCTSNAKVREIFAQGVIDRIRGGNLHPSLSPPDGRGYCQCQKCRAQDDPNSTEPSSGHVNVSNRYADFYHDVAKRVRQTCPDSVLSFYCYADYTQAPTSKIRLEPNLCAWIAPIRYSRYHRIGHPLSPSRQQLAELIDGWAGSAAKMGYRTYNYNLAECSVPFSKISVWKHDIPYLKQRGCIGLNLETLTNWQIYGPHIYLSIRLAYDPAADADALLDDYFLSFYGPDAGPAMKQYWLGVDRAFDQLDCESGSFFALHLVYTDEFLRACQQRIDQASAAVRGNPSYAARVEMAAEGLKNAKQYMAIRSSLHRGDVPAARRTYDQLLARSEKHRDTKLGNHYTVGYLKRFLGTHVQAAATAVAPPRRVVKVLPDTWQLAYDENDSGTASGFHRPDFDDASWPEVATFSNTLDAQGLPDRRTILWYRCRLELPERLGNPELFFMEVDGDATVYVNGREVGASERKRKPFSVNVAGALRTGENVIVVRADHSSITELFLGGIIRPVYLVADGR